MRTVYWLLFLVFLLQEFSQWTNGRTIDAKEISTGKDVRISSMDIDKMNMEKLQELMKQVTNSSANVTTQITALRQGPCQCGGGVCSCCSRILYNIWQQKACVNVTYDPDEFSLTARISMNDRVLYTRSVSGKNPPPVCVPLPRLRLIKACVKFYNIHFVRRNIHLCVNMEGKFGRFTMFKVRLDCIRFGSNGLAYLKPEDGGGLNQIEFLPGDDDNDQEEDDYDYDDDDDDDDDDDLFDF